MTSAARRGEADVDNSVFLRGELAAVPEVRTLASGDEVMSFRLTVSRPPGAGARADNIDCASTQAKVRRCLDRAQPGQHLEVSGALHRRFWRSPAGVSSRYEVEVVEARVVRSLNRRGSDA